MAAYEVMATIELGDERLAPGDSTSDAALKKAGQSSEDVKTLVKSGALKAKD